MLNLDKDKRYLLACSFGPDSMALFAMLVNEGYDFEVAHVNYHYRKESDEEEARLRDYCKLNNVKIHVYDNTDLSTNNLEAKARDIRYNFFGQVYHNNNIHILLVAHNLDDFIETYYIQKKIAVYTLFYGIQWVSTLNNMLVIRPLLDYTKQDLMDYCDDNSIPYAIDSSNSDRKYLRNKIRQDIVSKMSDDEKYSFKEKVLKENEAQFGLMISVLQNGNIHSASYLSSLSDEEFNHAIHVLAKEHSIYSLSSSNIVELQKIVCSKKPNIMLNYKNYCFVKEYDIVRFVNMVKDYQYSYVLDKPGVLDTPYFYLDFRGDTSNRNVTLDDYPLTIRNADVKHKIKIKDYIVKVGRLFIDWKMPYSLRVRWPIILDKNNKPIYIPRYRKDYEITDKDNFYVK